MATEAHGAEEGGLVFHPMDQFIVKPLFGNGDVGAFTITNSLVCGSANALAKFM